MGVFVVFPITTCTISKNMIYQFYIFLCNGRVTFYDSGLFGQKSLSGSALPVFLRGNLLKLPEKAPDAVQAGSDPC